MDAIDLWCDPQVRNKDVAYCLYDIYIYIFVSHLLQPKKANRQNTNFKKLSKQKET